MVFLQLAARGSSCEARLAGLLVTDCHQSPQPHHGTRKAGGQEAPTCRVRCLGTQRGARTMVVDKIAIFRACFSGLKHVYGTYDPSTGRSWQVKSPVTDGVVLRHLNGIQPYGVYLLDGSMTTAAVADFDAEDTGPPLRFYGLARSHGIPVYVERSKTKGWHAWVFFSGQGIHAGKARRVVAALLKDIGLPGTEIFPKQDALVGSANYGNFINAPLFGRLAPQGRTVFVDPDSGFRVIQDQWALLQSIQRVPESALDSMIAPDLQPPVAVRPTPSSGGFGQGFSRQRIFGLPPCARRMLAQGVTGYQRVVCFRLAIHLKKAGLPQDAALACLRVWAGKNRPADGKGIITDPEIVQQTASAYASSYRGCGCEDPAVSPYCDPSCGIRSRSAAGPFDNNQANASNPDRQENHHVAHDTNNHS